MRRSHHMCEVRVKFVMCARTRDFSAIAMRPLPLYRYALYRCSCAGPCHPRCRRVARLERKRLERITADCGRRWRPSPPSKADLPANKRGSRAARSIRNGPKVTGSRATYPRHSRALRSSHPLEYPKALRALLADGGGGERRGLGEETGLRRFRLRLSFVKSCLGWSKNYHVGVTLTPPRS